MERVVATLVLQKYHLDEFVDMMIKNNYIVEIRNKNDKQFMAIVKEQLKEREEK